jgi:hypothetical protein
MELGVLPSVRDTAIGAHIDLLGLKVGDLLSKASDAVERQYLFARCILQDASVFVIGSNRPIRLSPRNVVSKAEGLLFSQLPHRKWLIWFCRWKIRRAKQVLSKILDALWYFKQWRDIDWWFIDNVISFLAATIQSSSAVGLPLLGI